MSTWKNEYEQILSLIDDKIKFRYVPKRTIDASFLLQAHDNIVKNEKI